MKNPYFTVGQIARPQGVRGEVKVRSFSDDPERFRRLTGVMLGGGHGPEEDARVDACRIMGDNVYLHFTGIDDRDRAETLRGRYIWIERKQAVPLADDTYYMSDLLDCAVVDEEGRTYGAIAEVIQTGSNDVYVVHPEIGKDILIPALKTVVSRVDIEGCRVTVRAEKVAPYAEI